MRKAAKRPNKMDFHLMDRVKICRSKQDVGKVTSTWNRTTGNPKNYYHKAQAGSRDVGKVGEGIQEPLMVLVFLFLKLQYGPKGVYLLPVLCIIFIHISVKKLTKKDIPYYRYRAQCCERNR